MTDLAKLVVRLEAQTGQYQAQLERAERATTKFENLASHALGRVTGALAAFASVDYLHGLFDSAVEGAERMGNLAKQVGTSVESLSQLQYAAAQNGAEIDSLNVGLRTLAKNAFDAADGTGEGAKAFQLLGISVKDAQGQLKPTDELLTDVAESFSQYADGAAKSAIAQKLFGRNGAELIPFLDKGRAGIQQLREEADRLGITMSGKASEAADEYKKAVARAEGAAKGLVLTVVSGLLPALTDAANAMTATADSSGTLHAAGEALGLVFKVLADLAMSFGHTMQAVGEDVGAIWAASAFAMKGEFGKAFDVIKLRREDDAKETAEFAARLEKLWGGMGDKVVAKAEKDSKKLKQMPLLGGAGDLTEAIVGQGFSRFKDPASPMTDLLDKWNLETMTSVEKSTAEFMSRYNRTQLLVDELVKNGKISQKEADARVQEITDEVISEFTPTAKHIGDEINKMTDKTTEYAIQAARSTQTILADFISSGFEGGLAGISQRFGKMLLDLAAQAEAAQLAKWLFGAEPGKGGGALSTLASWAGTFFGGGKAQGGDVQPGRVYKVNEGTPRSEWFAPSVAGRIIPHAQGEGGGGMTVVQNFYLPQGDSRATQTQLATNAARGLAMSRRNS